MEKGAELNSGERVFPSLFSDDAQSRGEPPQSCNVVPWPGQRVPIVDGGPAVWKGRKPRSTLLPGLTGGQSISCAWVFVPAGKGVAGVTRAIRVEYRGKDCPRVEQHTKPTTGPVHRATGALEPGLLPLQGKCCALFMCSPFF